ncbi:AaceriAFL166Cp [[Ashbya] aceris (nom. inval.)]|nr:AaceriAFL166Cp [[Ashbya] aceris (nom. inval.)]
MHNDSPLDYSPLDTYNAGAAWQHALRAAPPYEQLPQLSNTPDELDDMCYDELDMGTELTGLPPPGSVADEDIFALDEDAQCAAGPGPSAAAHPLPRMIDVTKGCELPADIEFANAARDNYRLWLASV